MKNKHRIIGNHCFINTPSGIVVKISAEDVPLFDGCRIRASEKNGKMFIMVSNRAIKLDMPISRFIAQHHHGDLKDKVVDHVDRDRTNNCYPENLRITTIQGNQLNRGGWSASGIPFKGVYPTTSGKYQVLLTHNSKPHYGGSFADMNDAAIEADKLSVKLRGHLLVPNSLNFGHLYDAYMSGSI